MIEEDQGIITAVQIDVDPPPIGQACVLALGVCLVVWAAWAFGRTIEGLERSTYMTREQQDFAAWTGRDEKRNERLFNTRYVLALNDGRVVTVSGLAMALLDRNEAFLLSGGAGRRTRPTGLTTDNPLRQKWSSKKRGEL
jgi:hypothetical protein